MMKTVFKRSLSVLLALVLFCGVVPFGALTVSAAPAAQGTITTGSIITYGSYPQTKVTDAGLISALNAQTLQADSTVTYGGNRYKRVYFTQYTPNYTTGTPNASNSYQDDNGYYINTVYWFKFEPIQWRVLSNTNGELFVMAEKILASRAYNQVCTNVTWETCTMRNWLNDDFYNTAFSSTERSKIRTSTVVNEDNPWYGTEGGNNTSDKLFLLSYSEVMNPAYGFSSSYSTYDTARQAQGTDFSRSQGLYVYTGSSYYENSCWWLRSPGSTQTEAGGVFYDGGVSSGGSTVHRTGIGARPAFKLNLTSDIFTSKANSTYNLKIVDAGSSLAVAGANASFNGGNYVSFPDGSVSFLVGALPTGENRKITITKSGYMTKTIYLENLNPYAQTVVRLEPQNSIANMVPDISTGSETINGPSISFMGQTFSMFSVDTKIDVPLAGSVSIENNVNEKTYKMTIGINNEQGDPNWGSNFNAVKNFVNNCSNNADTANLWNKLKNNMPNRKVSGGNIGFESKCSFAGYVEFDYSSGKMVLKEGGLIFTAEAAVSVSYPIPPVPVVYLKFELGGQVGASLFWTFTGSGVFGLNGEVELQLKPRIGVGIGNDSFLSLEIGLKGVVSGKVKFNAALIANPSLEEMFEAYLEAQAYFKAKAFIFETEFKTDFPKLELYPHFGGSKATAMSINKDDMKMMSRDYLLTQTKHAQSNSTAAASIDKQSVYPNGAPQLITLSNGSLLALWLDDDGTKTIANRTTLFYSVFDGSTWTTPAAVCGSDYADFSATVCTNGSSVGVLWQRGDEVFADDVTLETMLAHTDLVYSSFDGTSFSAPQIVGTAGNGINETGYAIESNGTDLTAVWIENSLNDFSLSTGTNAVYAQTLSGGVWQSIETVNSSVPGISSLAVGYTGNGRDIAWCADTDGNLSTAGDTELFVDNINVTNNAVDDLNVKFENGSFWFKSNGGLVKLNDDYSATDTGIAFDGNYNIIGNGSSVSAVFSQSDDFANRVMVSHQNADGTFTTPVSLYNNGTLVNAFSAVMNADGGITVAMDSKNLSTDPEAASPYTTTDFLVKQFGDSYDLAIGDSLSYDRTAVIPGGDLELAATVQNNGTADINGYTLTLTDASGNYLADTTVFDTLPSGAQADVSITYTLPENLVGHEVKLTATPLADVIETDTSNNTAAAQIGLGDLSVSSQIEPNAGGALITTTVTNSGYTPVNAGSLTVKQLSETPELLDTQAIGTLAPGEITVKTFQVGVERLVFDSEYNGKTFISEVSTEQDENDYANNDSTAVLSPVRVGGLDINLETMTLALDETGLLTAAVSPGNVFNPAVYYISDSTDVATVDENGTVTAVGIGTAIITAISSDGGFVKHSTVTVQSNKLTAGENGTLIVGSANGFVTGIDLSACTAAEFRAQLANTNTVVLDENGAVLPGASNVGTGCVVQLLNNAGAVLDSKTIVVFGDVNGDGNITGLDAGIVTNVENYVTSWDPVADAAFIKAADVNGDGNVNGLDAGILVDVENYMRTIDQTTGLAG